MTSLLSDLAALNRAQWAAFIAAVLGWTLDAFDFFLMVFVVKAVAHDFHATIAQVSLSIAFTLMLRPFGAFFFGWLAEKFGRRPILMLDILLFSFFELASAFAPSLPVFLILRALFGFAMGGEWGVGASLVMESIPVRSRGTVSGILQEGYPLGYLLASLVYFFVFDHFGWRGMFIAGVAPALLVLFIRLAVKESPVWEATHATRKSPGLLAALARHWKTFFYVVLLMTAFNFFSHGTQDLYPTFLQVQHKLDVATVSTITIIMNLGAILGGLVFGFWSQRIGRRRAIVIASLLALPILPLWAFSATPLLLGLGAFLLQIAVQGAWGVIPAHLNELSPPEARGMFPGFAYQVGNLFASCNAPFQAWLAAQYGGNFGLALALVLAAAALAITIIAAAGPERRESVFGSVGT
ncbi:MAG TPA: MFS transporter [Candidatus Methylacidiphilales bacterium]|jgi:SHS family lactate transporter-like MFS transporter|nr:MFS transporter [Candidatus Methylacidiphilales bacterium]